MYNSTGASPSGKAAGFDPAMRWFESSRPCHITRPSWFRVDRETRRFFSSGPPSVKQVLRVSKMMIFTGNANPDLARRVAAQLYIPLGDASIGKFSDGEVSAEINENVRGKDVFLIQPTCAPTNDNLMELIVMIDASAALQRRASLR